MPWAKHRFKFLLCCLWFQKKGFIFDVFLILSWFLSKISSQCDAPEADCDYKCKRTFQWTKQYNFYPRERFSQWELEHTTMEINLFACFALLNWRIKFPNERNYVCVCDFERSFLFSRVNRVSNSMYFGFLMILTICAGTGRCSSSE